MISKPLTVKFEGKEWHLYGAEWSGSDGRFGFHFYAISDEHAHLVLAEIKQGALLAGRIVGAEEAP